MIYSEVIAKKFNDIAVFLEQSPENPKVKEALAKVFYAMAGVINGTFDFETATIHWRLARKWDDNIERQQFLIDKFGSKSVDFQNFFADCPVRGSVKNQLQHLGLAPDQLDKIVSDIKEIEQGKRASIYLSCKLADMVAEGIDRKEAMLFLMSLNLSDPLKSKNVRPK
jgi:hypothetical protein